MFNTDDEGNVIADTVQAYSTPISSDPYDDPRDHDYGYTEAQHHAANRSIFSFFRGQAQGTVTIREGKTSRGDSVANHVNTYSDEPRIYGLTYDEYAALPPGARADLRHEHGVH